jgi:hypothetical protein
VITSFTLLAPAECLDLELQVKKHRDVWIPRGAQPGHFFTLGAASYLDEPDQYTSRSSEMNPILREDFGWLYTKLTDFLSRRLHAPVGFAENLALPGFHIWETPAIFTRPLASVHFDLQYLRTWPKDAPGVDFAHPLSFTLPIRLPRLGGALNVWDVTYERYLRFARQLDVRLTPADITVLLDRIRHPYTVGALSLHSGHLLHQIAEVDEVFPGDERITLQGHALCAQGEWRLYW